MAAQDVEQEAELEWDQSSHPPLVREPGGEWRPASWEEVRQMRIAEVFPTKTVPKPDTEQQWAKELDDLDKKEEAELSLEPETFEAALDRVFAEMRAVMVNRRHKYGHRNISKSGEVGVVVRLCDKAERIHNAYFDEDGKIRPVPLDFGDDSLDDGFYDLANYSAIALMLRHSIWGLPLKEE